MFTKRDGWVLLGRVVVAVIAVMLLAYLGRSTSSEPTPKHTQHVTPATDEERLRHDVRRAWEIDQATKKS